MRLKQEAGFYTLVHKPTGKVYFGYSANVCRRVYHHAHGVRNGVHSNPIMRRLGRNWREYKVVVTYMSLEEAQAWALKYNTLFRESDQCMSKPKRS
jgi:predicted GIY-YIG superfamily endonuclease